MLAQTSSCLRLWQPPYHPHHHHHHIHSLHQLSLPSFHSHPPNPLDFSMKSIPCGSREPPSSSFLCKGPGSKEFPSFFCSSPHPSPSQATALPETGELGLGPHNDGEQEYDELLTVENFGGSDDANFDERQAGELLELRPNGAFDLSNGCSPEADDRCDDHIAQSDEHIALSDCSSGFADEKGIDENAGAHHRLRSENTTQLGGASCSGDALMTSDIDNAATTSWKPGPSSESESDKRLGEEAGSSSSIRRGDDMRNGFSDPKFEHKATRPEATGNRFAVNGTQLNFVHDSRIRTSPDAADDEGASDDAIFGGRKIEMDYYDPQIGDIVLGTVVSGNENKIDLRIGACQHGIMLAKNLRPLPYCNFDELLFQIPRLGSSDWEGMIPPWGKSYIVSNGEDLSATPTGGPPVDIGTVIMAEVEGKTMGGRAILSVRRLARSLVLHRVRQIQQENEAIEVRIGHWNSGGLTATIEGLRVFLPKGELLQKIENVSALKSFVGKTMSVMIIEISEGPTNVIVSEKKSWIRKNIQQGKLHDAIITRLYPYGIQVQVENTKLRGFVHVSNVSSEYVKDARVLFAEGEKVKVMVTKSPDPDRIAFSIAELESEKGLILLDKERVFREAEEMVRQYSANSAQGEQDFTDATFQQNEIDFEDHTIANWSWLDFEQGPLS